jgi:beta-glucosidase
MKLGLFENPYIDESKSEAIATDPAHRQLARTAAQQTFVLLRNEGKLLPLNKSLKSVAVIGQLANSQKDIMGSWVFVAKNEETISVLQGIKNKLPGAQITYVRGAQVRRPFPSPVEMPQPPVAEQTEADLQQQMTEAVNAAKNSDVSILVLGELQNQSGEAASRSSLDLPGAQQKMLEAVVAVGKPVVLVLLSGRPLNITWAASHVPAILEAWYPGSEGGNAIADTLFGDSIPAGKLPISWPRSAGQEPLYYAHNLTQEVETKPDFKSRYWDDSSFPLYPFGYGLSYTNFAFSNLKLSAPTMKADGKIDVSIDVQNTGDRAGDEIVQLYIHQQAGSASRPVRQLKGFERITLAAGERKTITFPLTKNELQYWSPQTKQWVVEPEKFDVWVGEDSKAATHAEFAVTAK